MVGTYTCKCQTQVAHGAVVHDGTLKAYTFLMAKRPEFSNGITNGQWLFLTELSERTTPHMRSWLEGCANLQTPITEAMGSQKRQQRSRQGQP